MDETRLCNAMIAYGETVYRLALCRTQNPEDAEDVYQEVFLRLLGQDMAKWEGERLKAWLIRTTVNRCNDLHRFRLRRKLLPLEEVPDLAEAEDGTTEQASELWTAVAALPPKLRTVVHLHYAEGYATEEIAKILGVPSATVRTRLYRGRKQLKELLGGMEDEA